MTHPGQMGSPQSAPVHSSTGNPLIAAAAVGDARSRPEGVRSIESSQSSSDGSGKGVAVVVTIEVDVVVVRIVVGTGTMVVVVPITGRVVVVVEVPGIHGDAIILQRPLCRTVGIDRGGADPGIRTHVVHSRDGGELLTADRPGYRIDAKFDRTNRCHFLMR